MKIKIIKLNNWKNDAWKALGIILFDIKISTFPMGIDLQGFLIGFGLRIELFLKKL